jgi:hypothetical protein
VAEGRTVIFMAAKQEPLEVELLVDPDWVKMRRWREEQYRKVGITDFTGFRLALIPDLDWHKVVAAAEAGATDEMLVDLFID